jgi:alkylhydroperoxidase family enzyme
MSTRSAVALQRGATEEMLDAVDTYDEADFTDEQKAALQLADVYLVSPAHATQTVKAAAAEHLTALQAVEVVLKLMGYSSDKVLIALGLDLDEMTRIEM